MNRSRRILLGLWIGLVLGAASATIVWLGLPAFSRDLAFWFGACLVGEVLWVRLSAGAATISMASCFNFAALLVLAPREAMFVASIATIVAELAVMRKPLIRALFNGGQTLIAVALAGWCFDALGGHRASLVDLVSSFHLLPFLAAGVVYYAVNRGSVVVVVSLAESIGIRESWHRNFGSTYDPLSCAGTLSLGALLATQYGSLGMIGTVFIVLPLVLACDGYRRFTRDAHPAVSRVPEDHEKAA
jgi:hypothetical protein